MSLEWTTIGSDDLSATIDPQGAQLSALKDHGGHDLLWNGDPSIWAGRAPILFPIVGALAQGHYRWSGLSYALSRHGFARGTPFALLEAGPAFAELRLIADDTTRAVYPFSFELRIRFEIRGASLTVTATVTNRGAGIMPASFGYHPAFRWPLPFGQPRTSHGIEFEFEEPDPVRRLDTAGLLTPVTHPSPIVKRHLALADELFRADVLIFDRLRSRSVTYGAATGPRIRVSFPDAAYLGLWTKPGAPFICIEPWNGVADPEGYAGDIAQKPGIFVLAAEESRTTTMAITLLPAAPAANS